MNEVQRFNRRCAIAALLFLLLTVGGRLALNLHQTVLQSEDFVQYFMAGTVARAGAWDALYPIPRPDSCANPGKADDSDLQPRTAQLATAAGAPLNGSRFIQPPLLALLLIPLAWMPYTTSLIVWTLLLTLATWGIGVQAGKIYSFSRGRADRWAGICTLLVCISPQAHRWARVPIMSAVQGWLIGVVLLEMVRRDSVRGVVALVLGAVSKYAVLVLAPLHVIMGRWRTLVIAAIVGLVLVGLSLLVMGTTPYAQFFDQIVPTLGRSKLQPDNQALYALMLRASGVKNELSLPASLIRLFHALEFSSLVGILIAIFLRRHVIRAEPRCLFAAALALISWLLVFSPIFWEHYHAYLGPLWGWILAEAMRSRGRLIAAVCVISLTYVPWTLVQRRLHVAQFPEPLHSHLLWATVLMGAMAIYSLLATRRTTTNP